ncbi:uncharacterized protein LOC107361825, partial [Tetranychus urticae]|uniref:uncharacterized protein LOC107361825 n=1 Tax=Tetranychus urticae TaxID=32264 RepID=UPI000D650863
FISILLGTIESIKLRRFGVPGAVANGSSVWLHCDYDLENDSLYSVKWYKNYEEFYGYLPSSNGIQHKVFPQRGINIDLLKSNSTHVCLESIDLNTEGTFGCEVSTEAPVFRTVKAEKDLRIYVSPTSHLKVFGLQEHYNIHDTINLTCIGGPSKPPMLIAWFINDKKVDPSSRLIQSISSTRDIDGLYLSLTTLTFPLKSTSISNGDLIISCEALFTTIYGVTYKELIIEEKSPSSSSSSSSYSTFDSTNEQSEHENEHHHGHQLHPSPSSQTPHHHSLDTDYPVTSESFPDSDSHSILRSPSITGFSSIYSIGTILQVNCSTEPSHPPAYLEWFINDREALKEELVHFNQPETIKLTSSIYDNFGVFGDSQPKASQLGLQLKIAKEHYQTSDGFLRIRCKATHAKIISWEKSQLVISSNGKQSSQLYASHPVTSDSLEIISSWLLSILLAVSLSLSS